MIYPDNQTEMAGRGWKDTDLEEILQIVNLNHIVTREGGWDVAADWKVSDVKSDFKSKSNFTTSTLFVNQSMFIRCI